MAKQLTTGAYADPSAAHERAAKLQRDGMKAVTITKTPAGWVIAYVDPSLS